MTMRYVAVLLLLFLKNGTVCREKGCAAIEAGGQWYGEVFHWRQGGAVYKFVGQALRLLPVDRPRLRRQAKRLPYNSPRKTIQHSMRDRALICVVETV